MLRRSGIRTKVLVILAVPVVVLALLAVVVGLVTGAGSTSVLAIAAVAVVAVVLHGVLASAVARSISRPLEELGAAADEVSESLPSVAERVGAGEDVEFAEIPVETDDEIGRLTAAINALSTSTISFAKTRAAASVEDTDDVRAQIAGMFVNVARRDQTLLKRLLSQLDQLERAEENPDTLDALFKLDHLATRMRRNAESLLVLAGRESSRRRRQPMPLTDVVRSASSEIEHYERVDLAQYVDPAMLGHSALPTAHLLA
jgi:methyl-accepting chemotaxis protein